MADWEVAIILAPVGMSIIFLYACSILAKEEKGLVPLRILLFLVALYLPLVSLSSSLSIIDANNASLEWDTYNALVAKHNSAFAASTRIAYIATAYFIIFFFYWFASYFIRRGKDLRGEE